MKNNAPIFALTLYGLTMLIWLCANLHSDTPVYAEMPAVTNEIQAEAPTEATTETEIQTTTAFVPPFSVPSKLEKYVIGVTAAEMPVYFHPEALKAQAVAARTYAMREYLADNNVDLLNIGQAYLSEQEMRERWGADFNENYRKIKRAVTDTEGELLLYDGEPILAAFCSASGGMTEQSENVWGTALPYLKSVDSHYDKKSPVYMQNVSVEYSLLSSYLKVKDASDIHVYKRSGAGYVLGVKVGGREFSGDDIRLALGLRSNDFYIETTDTAANFTVYGYGHGVGMSQYGAGYMAESGDDYTVILSHYYTDTQLCRAKIE